MVFEPNYAYRTCDSCRDWLYNDETGQVMRDQQGRKIKRLPHLPPRCRAPGAKPCPRGDYSDPKGFDEDTYAIYCAVKEAAVSGLPIKDGYLRAFARVVSMAEQAAARHKERAERQLQVELAVFNSKRQQRPS